MTTVKDHYDSLLGTHYTRSRGPFSGQVEGSMAVLEAHGIAPRADGATAIDLGCGAGAQSVALAKLGFSVVAIDQCAALLEELEGHVPQGAQVERVQGDLLALDAHCVSPAQAIVCMGDTLTHLASPTEVEQLFAVCAAALAPGGHLVVTYRDLSFTLEGVDRFIPVFSDADMIFTCFLEYGPDVVMVHDLIYLRQGDGWRLERSAYPKLRLSAGWVHAAVENAGLRVQCCEGTRGMVTLVAVRAGSDGT